MKTLTSKSGILKRDYKDEQNVHLLNFQLAINKHMPHVMFHPWNARQSVAYTKHSKYILGFVGYYDNTHSGPPIDRYCVQSRLIQNDKYASYSDNHHTVASKHMGTAVKNAMRYLLPVATSEIIANTVSRLCETVRSEHYRIERELEVLVQNVSDLTSTKINTGKSKLYRELEYLVKSGHQWFDPSVGTAIEELVGNVPELQQDIIGKSEMKFEFVRIFDNPLEGKGIATRELNFKGGLLKDNKDTVFATILEKDIPEDMAGKLAVLSIVEDGTYVEDVGMKIDEETFYVAKDTDSVG